MEIIKRFSSQLVILLVLCIISSVGIITEKTVNTSNNVKNRNIIIIDAGHGGLTNTIMVILYETVLYTLLPCQIIDLPTNFKRKFKYNHYRLDLKPVVKMQ